jgi:hypothetical protein
MNALKVVTCGAENRPVIDPAETFGASLGLSPRVALWAREAGGQSS